MSGQDWEVGYARSLGVFINGAFLGLDDRGQPITDDSFLLLFNAHNEPVEFRLPDQTFGREWKHQDYNASGIRDKLHGCRGDADHDRSARHGGHGADRIAHLWLGQDRPVWESAVVPCPLPTANHPILVSDARGIRSEAVANHITDASIRAGESLELPENGAGEHTEAAYLAGTADVGPLLLVMQFPPRYQ